MKKRPDAITISLGGYHGDHEKQRAALTALASNLNLNGQRGPSISRLMSWLADIYIDESDALVKLLEIAAAVSRGDDLNDYLKYPPQNFNG